MIMESKSPVSVKVQTICAKALASSSPSITSRPPASKLIIARSLSCVTPANDRPIGTVVLRFAWRSTGNKSAVSSFIRSVTFKSRDGIFRSTGESLLSMSKRYIYSFRPSPSTEEPSGISARSINGESTAPGLSSSGTPQAKDVNKSTMAKKIGVPLI